MRIYLVVASLLLHFNYGMSQVQTADSPATRKQQTIVSEPVTLYRGFVRAGIGMDYNTFDNVFQQTKKQVTSDHGWGKLFSFSLFTEYGVSDRLMVGIAAPYMVERHYHTVAYELPLDASGQFLYPQKWKTQANGLGDIDIATAYQFLPETRSRPALAAFITATLPTGEANYVDNDDGNANTFDLPTGQGEFAVNTELRMRRIQFPFSYSASVSYKYRTESSKVMAIDQPAVDYRNGNLLNFSGSFDWQMNEWIALRNSADYVTIGKSTLNGENIGGKGWLLRYHPAISFQLKNLRLNQGAMIPVKGRFAQADAVYQLTAQYTF